MMDDLLISRLRYWYGDGLPVDGWVEQDEKGRLYIELFANKARELKVGDYVRVKVIKEEDVLDETVPTKT